MELILDSARSFIELMNTNEFLCASNLAGSVQNVSLLTLKNEMFLSYINNILLIVASQVSGTETAREVFDDSVKRAIEQRISLEKGIKGLESKISYQLDKAVRAYLRAIEQNERNQSQAQHNISPNETQFGESDEDPLSFRPRADALDTSVDGENTERRTQTADHSDSDVSSEEGNKSKYVAPKVFAAIQHRRERPRRRNIVMEEYLRENDEAPVAQPSIGTTILDEGRGGERTYSGIERDRQVREYEEATYTRISSISAKQARREALQRQRDARTKNLFGEEWGFMDEEGALQQKKSRSSGKKRTKRRKH